MKRPFGPWALFLILLVALCALVFWLVTRGYGPPQDQAARAEVLRGVVLAALIGAGVVHGWRTGFKGALGAAMAWLAIGAGLVLLYSYRFTFLDLYHRLVGELAPGQVAQAPERRALTVRRAADGHFYVTAMVNSTRVRFMVDTGASHTVLDPRDAVRVGRDPRDLAFTQRFNTANGVVRAAPVTLDLVEIGPLTFHQVSASVNAVPIGTSLLGNDLLGRFRAWRVANDTLTLEY